MLLRAGAPTPTGSMATFPKRLKEIDKDLNIQWNPVLERFTIHQKTCNPQIPNALICVVKNENGSFRHPDMRDISFLRQADIRNEGPKERERRVAEYMIDEREKHRKNTKDEIRHATRENKIQLVNVVTKAANIGKGNSAFRRIKAKARGEVY